MSVILENYYISGLEIFPRLLTCCVFYIPKKVLEASKPENGNATTGRYTQPTIQVLELIVRTGYIRQGKVCKTTESSAMPAFYFLTQKRIHEFVKISSQRNYGSFSFPSQLKEVSSTTFCTNFVGVQMKI